MSTAIHPEKAASFHFRGRPARGLATLRGKLNRALALDQINNWRWDRPMFTPDGIDQWRAHVVFPSGNEAIWGKLAAS